MLGAESEDRPLLLVIESLHDAAPAFVGALGAAAGLLETRPVLILATMRPNAPLPEPWAELTRASTLALGALDDANARALLRSVLLEGAAVSEAAREAVLERSAGNPLYVIEFARMLAESGADEAGTPASVQAVIAARLDAIPAEVRALAQDAAVLGDEVWADALASMRDIALAEVRDGLEELGRRGLLERRASSLPDRDAYGFAHELIREVAYGRLPRAARARRHFAAALWLEGASGQRVDEWAESLARHYATAAEFARASNEPEIAERASGPALRWLIAAGHRASRVDPAAAFATFERALALALPETREREEALWRSANAGRRSGLLDAQEVLARTEEALAIARTRNDDIAAGELLTRIGTERAATGDVDRARKCLAEAVETLERHPPGRALARAYAYRAEEEHVRRRHTRRDVVR